jgi:hypothetical protein
MLALGGQMRRHEAVALLKELGSEHLLQPSLVLIEQRKPDRFQLCIKGEYDLHEIEAFVQKHNLAIQENLTNGLLCIFRP